MTIKSVSIQERDGNVRIQFETSPARLVEIERLMEICNIETKKDFLNQALTMLKWAIRQTQRGNLIASVDEKNNIWRELQMPCLGNIVRDDGTLGG